MAMQLDNLVDDVLPNARADITSHDAIRSSGGLARTGAVISNAALSAVRMVKGAVGFLVSKIAPATSTVEGASAGALESTSLLGRVLPFVGGGAAAINVGIGLHTHDGHRVMKSGGIVTGMAAGAGIGAAIGVWGLGVAAIPVAMVGAGIGGAVGWLGGFVGDHFYGDKLDVALKSHDRLPTRVLAVSPHPEPGQSPDIAQRQADKLKASQDLALINYVADSSSVAALSPPPNGHKQVVERA